MKKISDMTLTELQDYALQLEQEKAAQAQQLEAKDTENKELTAANLLLQKRNNELFMKVEAGTRNEPTPEPETDPESCEEFAAKNINNILKG